MSQTIFYFHPAAGPLLSDQPGGSNLQFYLFLQPFQNGLQPLGIGIGQLNLLYQKELVSGDAFL